MAGYKSKFIRNLNIDGVDYNRTVTITKPGVEKAQPLSGVPLAKAGTLTTRGGNTAGTATLGSGHGITTGARADIYWTESGVAKHRRGVLVGTVATNDVPFTGGTGDNLAASTGWALTMTVPTLVAFSMTGDDLAVLGVESDKEGLIVFTLSDGTYVTHYYFPSGGDVFTYVSDEGGTNPFAGVAVAKCYFSQKASSGDVAAMDAAALKAA